MLRQVMGPDYSDTTSETLQFAKFNGTNYHVWSDNMKAALQAKSLWGVVSGREACPVKPPSDFPDLMTSPGPSEDKSPVGVRKDGQDLMDVLQSKEYVAWEKSCEKYDCWLNKDDAAMGIIRNAVEYTQRETIVECKSSMTIWEQLRVNFVEQYSGINVHYYYRELFTKRWNGLTSISDHIGFYYGIRRRFLEADHKVDDLTIIHAILLSLPTSPAWEVIKQTLLLRGKLLKLDDVSTELTLVFERKSHEENASTKSVALVAQTNNEFSGSKGNSRSRRTNRKRREPKQDDICYNCGEKGHWSSRCQKPKKDKSIGSANITISGVEAKTREVGMVFMATSGEMPVGLLLDSAASCHMISDKSYFTVYREVNEQNISVGGASQLPVEGTGTIEFKTDVPNGPNNVILHEVLHIPTLGANLISLGQLQRGGATINGLTYGISLAWNGDEFLRANLIGSHGTLYQIACSTLNDNNDQVAYIANDQTMRLWHRRLGHIAPRTIKMMMDKNLVTGLRINSPREFDRLCNGCAQGKAIRPPLPQHSVTKYDKNKLLVMDLAGPMSVPTWDNY